MCRHCGCAYSPHANDCPDRTQKIPALGWEPAGGRDAWGDPVQLAPPVEDDSRCGRCAHWESDHTADGCGQCQCRWFHEQDDDLVNFKLNESDEWEEMTPVFRQFFGEDDGA